MANELVTQVSNQIIEMQQHQGLSLPQNYSVGNALNAAWLILDDSSAGQSILQKCDRGTVAKALLDMAIQGLSPAKNQCYFIPYGKTCTLTRSYMGSMAVVKRLHGVKNIEAYVVRQGNDFEVGADGDQIVVTKWQVHVDDLDKPITHAVCVIEKDDGTKSFTIMTKKQIDVSWSHARTTKVQKEYPDEMAKRTVINRAAKLFINTSDDSDLFVQAVNDTTSDEYDNDNRKDVTPAAESKDTQDLLNNFQSSGQSQQSSTVSQSSQPASTATSAEKSSSLSAESAVTSKAAKPSSIAEDIINGFEQSQSSKGADTVDEDGHEIVIDHEDEEPDVHQGDIFNQHDNPQS